MADSKQVGVGTSTEAQSNNCSQISDKELYGAFGVEGYLKLRAKIDKDKKRERADRIQRNLVDPITVLMNEHNYPTLVSLSRGSGIDIRKLDKIECNIDTFFDLSYREVESLSKCFRISVSGLVKRIKEYQDVQAELSTKYRMV